MSSFAVGCCDIFPLYMALRLLELLLKVIKFLLKVVPDSSKKASTGRSQEECNEQQPHPGVNICPKKPETVYPQIWVF